MSKPLSLPEFIFHAMTMIQSDNVGTSWYPFALALALEHAGKRYLDGLKPAEFAAEMAQLAQFGSTEARDA